MNNENNTIHEFDFNLICEYFSLIERQGPGSIDSTKKALGFIDKLSSNSKILDIGCGTGFQTIVLAKNTIAEITAIDLFPKFIEILNKNVKNLNFQNKITSLVASMNNLPFSNEEFDVIWS